MPLLAVHGDFTSHAAGVHLKQKLEMSRTVAVGEIELVGYQVTFDSKLVEGDDELLLSQHTLVDAIGGEPS